MMKPTATTCAEMAGSMLKSEQARGMSMSEPPATPEVPQAPMAAMMHSRMESTGSTTMPSVLHAAMVMMAMVMEAPAMLMVAPSGMETE